MTYRPRWRKAIVISLIFHILFFGSVGWLSGKLFTSMEPEPYIELELLTDVAAEGPKSDESAPTIESEPQVAAQSIATPVTRSAVASPTVPKVVAVTDDLAVVEVEAASASQSTSDNEQGSNSSTASTTGGGTGSSGQGKGVGNGVGSGSGSKQITRPGILSKVEPVYPEAARAAGLEGTVVMKIQILANGLPGDITVNLSSGHSMLDEAAIAAVRKWRFIPAKNRDSGISIMCYTTMPVSFRLR